MRIKFVTAIAFLLVFSITIVSCLGGNDSYEYSPDATIKSFKLDTIYGVDYKFTIDQIAGRIYNVDSVPHSADTIINKILITEITTASYWVTTGDTLLNTSDSIDFSNSMEEPMKVKVYAPDGVNTKDYTISVRIHQQDPDSLVWKEMATNLSQNAFASSKTVIFNDNLNVYISNTALYRSPVSSGTNWTLVTVQNLPSNIRLSTVTRCEDKLYVLDENGQMYESTDGMNWQPSALTGKVITLLSPFSNSITAVVEESGVNRFAIADFQQGAWDLGVAVPEDFPVENISSTVYTTRTGIKRAVMVGKPIGPNAYQTVPWFTLDGKKWAAMDTSTEFYIPAMDRPTIIYYADRLYAYGDGFKSFYVSDDGLLWKQVEEKMLFPEEFDGRSNYSTVVDGDNYIWIIWNQQQGSNPYGNGVWKGRLNKLGFIIQ